MTPDQIAAVQAAPHAFSSRDISATIAAAMATSSSRQPLPPRRQSITVSADWNGHAFTVTIGFDADGQPREVFADNAKGDMQAVISDACVWASIAMQFGAGPGDLAKSLGRIPSWSDGEAGEGPASPIGAIAAAILAVVA